MIMHKASLGLLHSARRSVVVAMLAVTALLVAPATLLADGVKVNKFWIDNVEIQEIADGQIVYLNNLGSEISKPLSELEGIRMADVPELETALEDFEKQNWQSAERNLRTAARKAKPQWLQTYISFLTMLAQDQQGRADQAVQSYLNLARRRVDDFYLNNPPLNAVQSIEDEKELTKVAQRLEQQLPRLRGAAAQGGGQIMAILQKRLDLGGTQPEEASPTGGSSASGSSSSSGGGNAMLPGQTAAPSESAIVMSRRLSRDAAGDPVTRLLQEGKFQEALEMSEKILGGQVNQMGMRLYQQGLAELGLADASGSADRYKDAGLSFMRVVIYYPGGAMTPASTLEAAYVHDQIGREDIAAELYQRATLLIDEEEEPELYQRLMKLRGIEPDTEESES